MLLRPRILVPLLLALAVMASAPAAFARGENYSFEGGTGAQRAQRATGVATIISHAGVAKATFFHHFPAKSDLVSGSR